MMYQKTFPQQERERPVGPYESPSCKFTEGVSCDVLNRKCWKCGHNPEVAKKRLEAFCKKNGITIPTRKE